MIDRNDIAILKATAKKLDEYAQDLMDAGIVGYGMSIQVASQTIKNVLKGE